jgi:hypothetical protein
MLLGDLARVTVLAERRAQLLADIDAVRDARFVVTVRGDRVDADLLELLKPVLLGAIELRVAEIDMRIADYGVEIS